jgi:HEAT repeat protein
VRRTAITSLEYIGDATAVEPLICALKDDDIRVVQAAIHALGSLHDERAADMLVRFLDYPDWETRWDAAVALAKLHDRRAIPVLREFRVDRTVPVCLRREIPPLLWTLKRRLGKLC